MKVLLTGATGFLGSWVLEQLLDGGDTVAVLLRDGADTSRITACLERAQVIRGDLRDVAAFEPAVRAFAPDAVVHLAWDGVAGAERNAPRQWRNVSAALELVELAARCGAQHWVGVGSQAEYGPCANVISEDTPTHPTTLYGASKLATGQLAQALCGQLGLRFGWLRLFSSYGPRDNPSWLIPSLILALQRGERPAVTGAQQLWDYIHVADAAAAVVAVLRNPGAQGFFNLGSGSAPPLREVIETVRDLVAPGQPIGFGDIPYRPDQVMHLQADIRRLTQATGWRPVVALDEGLRSTVRWFAPESSGTT